MYHGALFLATHNGYGANDFMGLVHGRLVWRNLIQPYIMNTKGTEGRCLIFVLYLLFLPLLFFINFSLRGNF